MRIREILKEDYQSELVSDLTDVLLGAKGKGIKTLPTAALVQQLQQMGYSVDPDSLVEILVDNPAVETATPISVTLSGTDEVEQSRDNNVEDSAAHVDSLAQGATQKSMKK